MARELTIVVTAETRTAEAAMKRLDASFEAAEKNVKEFEQSLAKAEQTKAKATTAADGLTSAIKRYLTVGAILGAVKATTDWASALSDLSAKTGISTTMLQKLQIAAGDSGITVERMATAIQMMGDRLASGDKSALSALKALHLSFETIRNQSPDQAFLTIAQAVGKIEDPMQRAKVAADLFGRSGLDLTRLLNGQFVKAVEDATTASDESVQALDDMGDSFTRLWTSGKQLLATVLAPMAPVLNGIAQAAGYAAQGIGNLYNKIPSGFGALGAFSGARKAYDAIFGGTGPLPTTPAGPGVTTGAGYTATGMTETDISLAIKDLSQQTKNTTARQKRLEQATEDAAQALWAQAQMAQQLAKSTGWLAGFPGGQWQPPTGGWNGGGGGLFTTQLTNNSWGGIFSPFGMGNAMGYAGFQPTQVPGGGGVNWGGLLSGGLTAGLPWLSQLITGGSSQAQVGGTVGGIGGGLLGTLFKGASGALGAVAPFMGPILGMIGGLIGKLFGPSEGRVASQERGAWIQSLGGNEAFNDLFRNAQIAPDEAARLTNQLMSATSREGVKAAQDAINAAIARNNALLTEQAAIEAQIVDLEAQRKALADSLVPTYQQIVDLSAKYGLSLEGLGQQVAQLGTTTTFTTLINDMETLFRAGADVGGVLSGMSDEISALVQQSIKMGTTIPENMRPFIEELIRTGQLLDENGQAITDLSQLKWGDRVQTQAELVNAAMEKLDETLKGLTDRLAEIVDLLANRIPAAAQTDIPTVIVPWKYERIGDGTPGEDRDAGRGDVKPYASGGLVMRPTYALLGEAGPEAVIPLSRLRGRSSRPIVVQVALDGRVLAESVVRELPELLPGFGV